VLVSGGLHVDKVLQVIGMANNMGVDESQPDSPVNRRMTILVVSKSKEKQILMEDALIRDIAADENAARIQTQLKITTDMGQGNSLGSN
jgi:chemotaxis protein MotB